MLQQPLAILDQSHRILYANKPFYRLTGTTPLAAAGCNLRDVGDGLLHVPQLEEFLDRVESGSARAIGYRLRVGLGSSPRRTFVLSAQHIPPALSSGAIILAIEDITEFTLEQKAKRNEALHPASRDRQTASSISMANHDLRQPLQTLSLLQGVLAMKETDPELRKLIARFDEAIGALKGALDAMAFVDQLNAGPVLPEIVAFPINLVLDHLRTELSYHAESRGLGWHVIPCSVTVNSDPHLLGQVLRTLLINAMKRIKRGKMLFGCRRRGDKLVHQLWVAGAGFSAEQQQAILDGFHRTDGSSMEPNLVGTLIELLSEPLALDIKTWSRPGDGLAFAVEVPIDPHFTEAAIRHEKRDFKGTILVASDALLPRDELMLLLKELGHEPVSATVDGDNVALSPAKGGGMRPEVIIVDYESRNETTASQIVGALREAFGSKIPVIALVDDISKRAELNAIGKPCVYLPKPVPATELAQQIALLLADIRHRAAVSIRHKRDAPRQTIFVIDDDKVLRGAVQDVFRLQAQDVELYPSSESFLESYDRDRRGCLIVDNRLPGMTGVELLEQLRAEGSSLPSIMITAHGDVPTAVRALKAGAIDYIEKPISYEGLVSAVERALEIDRGSADTVVKRREMAARIAELTPREREVMDLVVSGRSSKKIAQLLNISQRTVENHRAAIMRRVGAASLPDLIRIAMQLRLSDNL